MKTDTLVTAVKRHAAANYEQDGWDFIVECYTDAELAELIVELRATTEGAAIRKVGELMKIKDERRKEIEATIW
jgi:hypothetical protein